MQKADCITPVSFLEICGHPGNEFQVASFRIIRELSKGLTVYFSFK